MTKDILISLLKKGNVLGALIYAQDRNYKGIKKLVIEYAPNNSDKRKYLGQE